MLFLGVGCLLIMGCAPNKSIIAQVGDTNLAEGNVPTKSIRFPLLETNWKLIAIQGNDIKPSVKGGKEMNMILNVKDSTVTGSGNCNRFHGVYSLREKNGIQFDKVLSTMMACELMSQESEYFKYLQTVDTYTSSINGDTLYLTKARLATLLTFKAVFYD